MRELLAAMVAKNPADRPADPMALQQQIQDCLAQTDRTDVVASAPAASAAAPITEVRRRCVGWEPLAFAAMLVVAAILAGAIVAQRTQRTVALETAQATASEERVAEAPVAAPEASVEPTPNFVVAPPPADVIACCAARSTKLFPVPAPPRKA